MQLWTLLSVALCAGTLQRVNPVEKVTALLVKLQAEVEEEGKSEAAAYDKYACFCKEQADNKQYAIAKFTEQENVLNGKIEAKTAKKAELDAEIVGHKGEVTSLEEEHTAAEGVRTSTNEAYKTTAAMLSQAISALTNAVDALQASKGDMKDSKAGYTLLSKYAATIKSALTMANDLKLSTSASVTRLLQKPDTAQSYSYHSNEIVSTLQGLLKEFRQKQVASDNDERADRQDFQMIAGARRNEVTALEKSVSEKAEASAALEEEINEHQTELQATEAAHAADQSFLNDLTSKCEQKSTDFDQRSSTRAAELTAISKAIELLKNDVSKMYPANDLGLVSRAQVVKPAPESPKSHKAHKGHWEWLPDTVAAKRTEDAAATPASFLQMSRPGTATRKKLMAFLTNKAKVLQSPVLSTLLLKLRDTPSPFQKVKQMIMDMVTRLEAEAADEASQKTWCDEQMKQTTTDRDDSQRKIEDKNAFVTEKTALTAQLTEEIATLGQQIADLQKGLNEQAELRTAEKLTNEQTIADARAGETAVAQAKTFLEEFYSGAKTALVQRAKETPAEGYERFSAENSGSDGKTVGDLAPDAGGVEGNYQGKQDASNSIIGLLQVIESDFQTAQTTTADEETAAEAAYQELKSKAEQDITDKNTLKGQQSDAQETAKLDIVQGESDLKMQEEMLQNSLDELEKLKPVCVDTGMSWEERKARREQEVESLKEALKILQNADFGL